MGRRSISTTVSMKRAIVTQITSVNSRPHPNKFLTSGCQCGDCSSTTRNCTNRYLRGAPKKSKTNNLIYFIYSTCCPNITKPKLSFFDVAARVVTNGCQTTSSALRISLLGRQIVHISILGEAQLSTDALQFVTLNGISEDSVVTSKSQPQLRVTQSLARLR